MNTKLKNFLINFGLIYVGVSLVFLVLFALFGITGFIFLRLVVAFFLAFFRPIYKPQG